VQGLDTLADPHEMHRQAVFLGDGNKNAAARRAVELGHGKTGHAGHVAEHLYLGERVLADGGIEHEQHRVRSGRIDLLHHAHHLFKLVHQHRLVLQPSCGIHQEEIDLFAARLAQGIEGEAGRIGAGGARDHRGAAAGAPDLELVDRRRAERVAGGQQHGAPLRAGLRGKLADGGGLAGTVHPDNQHDERFGFLGCQRLRHGSENLLHFARQHLLDLVGRDRLVVAAFPDRGCNPRRAVDPKIGTDQGFLDLVEHGLVEPALDDEIADCVADGGRRALETHAEPPPPAWLVLGVVAHATPVIAPAP